MFSKLKIKNNKMESSITLGTSKTIERPTEEDCAKFNPLSKPLPTNIRTIDRKIVLDIMDRIHGPQGLEYEEALRELNKKFEARKGKSGSDFYDPKAVTEYIQSTYYQ